MIYILVLTYHEITQVMERMLMNSDLKDYLNLTISNKDFLNFKVLSNSNLNIVTEN